MGTLPLKITDTRQFDHTPEVASRYTDAQKAKIADAAKQFESLLTSMMLKSMTKTTDGMFGDKSLGGDDFEMIFQNDIASFISQNRNLGIASMLYKKITGENLLPERQGMKIQSYLNGDSLPIKINLNNSNSVTPSRNSLQRLSKYDDIINEAANTFGVDKNLIKSVILTESAANDKAISKANAKGLMQLIDSTANSMGVQNVWDPKQNIYGGTKYLATLIRKYNGDLNLALASYNAGPENVDKYGGIPPFEETQNYISRVNGYLKHFNGVEDGNE
jgi:Rod binding domain-containing protein